MEWSSGVVILGAMPGGYVFRSAELKQKWRRAPPSPSLPLAPPPPQLLVTTWPASMYHASQLAPAVFHFILATTVQPLQRYSLLTLVNQSR